MAIADTCAGVTGGGGSFSVSFIQPLARGFELKKMLHLLISWPILVALHTFFLVESLKKFNKI